MSPTPVDDANGDGPERDDTGVSPIDATPKDGADDLPGDPPDDPPDSGDHGSGDGHGHGGGDDHGDDHGDDPWDDCYHGFDWEDYFWLGFWYGQLHRFGPYPYWHYHALFYWHHHYFLDYPWYHFWFGYYPIYHRYCYPRYVYYEPLWYPGYDETVFYYPVYIDAEDVEAPEEEPYIDPDLAEELDRLKGEEAAVEALEQGAVKFKSGEYAEAAEAFRQAVVLAPKNAVPKFAFAHALFARGEYAYAAFMIRRGMELLPSWPSVGTALHELYGNPDDLVEHIIALRTYLAVHENDVEAWFLLAYVSFFSGDLDGAEEQFNKVLSMSPDHVETQAFLSRIAEIRAEFEKESESPVEEAVEKGG